MSWNKTDFEAFKSLTNSTFTYFLGGQPPRDISTMQQFLQAVHMAFPDWQVEVQDIVAVRWSGKAIHKGVFYSIPPIGKQISVCGTNMYRIENGKISEEWEQMDSLGMLQQLGILPPQKS